MIFFVSEMELKTDDYFSISIPLLALIWITYKVDRINVNIEGQMADADEYIFITYNIRILKSCDSALNGRCHHTNYLN